MVSLLSCRHISLFVAGVPKKKQGLLGPAVQTYSNPIILIVVAAPEAALKEYRNLGMVL
jgi:hypothetical protein